jgi:GAF domain-containing protein
MTIEKLKLLAETVQQLSLARDIETIIRVVRTVARKLTGADGATFVLRDNGFCYYVDEDAIGPLWKGQRFPMSACISGWAMLNKKYAVVNDIYHDSRIPVEAYSPTFVKSLVTVPIRSMDPLGAIGNYWAEKHEATADEIELLQALADITSVSIANVYAYDELISQNKKLGEIAFLQAHQVRAPIANILGLANLFNFDNPSDPVNAKVLTNLRSAVETMDGIVKEIVIKADDATSRVE